MMTFLKPISDIYNSGWTGPLGTTTDLYQYIADGGDPPDGGVDQIILTDPNGRGTPYEAGFAPLLRTIDWMTFHVSAGISGEGGDIRMTVQLKIDGVAYDDVLVIHPNPSQVVNRTVFGPFNVGVAPSLYFDMTNGEAVDFELTSISEIWLMIPEISSGGANARRRPQ